MPTGMHQLSGITVVAPSPPHSPNDPHPNESKYFTASDSETGSVMIGGMDFGFSGADMVRLEACVIHATEVCRELAATRQEGQETDQDDATQNIENEIDLINEQFICLKDAVLKYDVEGEGDQDTLRDNLRLLSDRVRELICDLDGREWDEDDEISFGVEGFSFQNTPRTPRLPLHR